MFDDKMAAQIFRSQQVLETDNYNFHRFCFEIFIFLILYYDAFPYMQIFGYNELIFQLVFYHIKTSYCDCHFSPKKIIHIALNS